MKAGLMRSTPSDGEARPGSEGPEETGLRPTEVRLLETLLRDGGAPGGEVPP